MTITPELLDEIEAALGEAEWALVLLLQSHGVTKKAIEDARSGVTLKVRSALAKLRDARKAEPAPVMSAETMREKAASVAEGFSTDDRTSMRQFNEYEIELVVERDYKLGARIRAIPLTESKEG
jgi:hypothetical protein